MGKRGGGMWETMLREFSHVKSNQRSLHREVGIWSKIKKQALNLDK